MIMGAVTAFAAAYHSGSPAVGVLAALLMGALLASIHAFLTITLRTDQVVTGLAVTLFGTGLASFLGQNLGPEGKPLVGVVGPQILRRFCYPSFPGSPIWARRCSSRTHSSISCTSSCRPWPT